MNETDNATQVAITGLIPIQDNPIAPNLAPIIEDAKIVFEYLGESRPRPETERALSALGETFLDVLERTDAQELDGAFRTLNGHLREAEQRLNPTGDDNEEWYPAYVAGQVSSMVELLGLATERSDTILLREVIDNQKIRPVLWMLPCNTEHIIQSGIFGKDPGQVSRKLTDLDNRGVIVRRKEGREAKWRLSQPAEHILHTDYPNERHNAAILDFEFVMSLSKLRTQDEEILRMTERVGQV